MSNTLFDRNPDLRRLRDEGFDLALSASNNHLLVRDVPYVDGPRGVKRGTLIEPLNLSGDVLNPPRDHTIYFRGEQPCDAQGRVITGIQHPDGPADLDKELRSDRKFSGRPPEPYATYFDKIVAYVLILEGPARAIQPGVSARTFPPYEMQVNESIFKYADTASSRAKITALSTKLEAEKVAIVGLGGTGSYLLDFLVKTPIKELHVFDGDLFASHNAFRSPGAASLAALRTKPTKAAYHKAIYENLRHEIVAHEYSIGPTNVSELDSMTFVFLSMDGGPTKKVIVDRLIARGIGFVDVGMGLDADRGEIAGLLTVTTCTALMQDHLARRISFGEATAEDEYDTNIQVVELNALNAALAVIKWKKLQGFYASARNEHFTVYTLAENTLINGDVPD